MSEQEQKTSDHQLLKQVFIHNLNRIYFGKNYLKNNLEYIISIASFKNLQFAINEFKDDVKKQIARMEVIYGYLNEKPSDNDCNPIKSIVKDQFCLREDQPIAALRDMDIMLYLQLLEHVNITSYRMLIIIAKKLGYNEVGQLLKECFDESKDNDQLFTIISKQYLPEDQ